MLLTLLSFSLTALAQQKVTGKVKDSSGEPVIGASVVVKGNNTMGTITDFAQAHPIGKNAWVGRKWTVYVEGPKANILANRDLVWGYYFKQTGKYSVSQLRVFNMAKKMISINLSEDEAHEALKYYAEEQPHMIVGYTKELETSFQKNFTEFLNLKYNPAINAEQADPYFGNNTSF